ncbi:MAG: hypothetical protein JRF53_06510 [Deltaproteobacteria bacterium]|nr:hypothetical protein [Deltaproteobacteria bacterium]
MEGKGDWLIILCLGGHCLSFYPAPRASYMLVVVVILSGLLMALFVWSPFLCIAYWKIPMMNCLGMSDISQVFEVDDIFTSIADITG